MRDEEDVKKQKGKEEKGVIHTCRKGKI